MTNNNKATNDEKTNSSKNAANKAAALSYDGQNTPTLSAKGEGLLAEEIIAIAEAHQIPLYENPELVALLSQMDIGEEIPESLFVVIAEVIAFAYYLRGMSPDNDMDSTIARGTNINTDEH